MLLLPAAAVAVLIVLIVRLRMHAFPALMIVSLGLGLAAGLPPTAVAQAFQDGVGSTLGFVAIVIGLGTFAGALLADSGGARVVAHAATRAIGPARLPWAVAFVGFVVGLPIFFSVGLVLLFPVVAGLAAATARPVAALALPLVAGLSASHGLVAPHPGPLVAIDRLGADTGLSIFYGILVGIPCTAVAGPIFARHVLPRLRLPLTSDVAAREPERQTGAPPGVTATLTTVLLPVVLMLGATVATPRLTEAAAAWVGFIGNPAVALLIGTLAATWVFGYRRGLTGARLLAIAEESLLPIASVLLVVGAGGGFGRVLDQAGIGAAIVDATSSLALSPMILGWLIAAALRIAVGSATVAITTAAAIVAPVAAATPGTNMELLVVALGAGSLIASHVNDGGFWLVKEFLGLDVPTTLKTWTVIETIIAVVGLIAVLMIDLVV